MIFLFLCDAERGAVFADAFARHLPEVQFVMDAASVDADAVSFIMTWDMPADLARYSNLQALLCIGAGVDHLAGAAFPDGVKLVRMVDDSITAMVAEYVAMAVLALHRDLHLYIDQQRHRVWQSARENPRTIDRRVSILGTGVLGKAALRTLRPYGFQLAGWNRSAQIIEGAVCYQGRDGLHEMLSKTDILVCLLPLTDATAGILDRDLFERLPMGASLVHAGRGRQLDADALIEALDSGRLSGAFLDVTDPDPLPVDQPLWAHPRIVITPHVAATTHPASAALTTIDNVKRLLANEEPVGLVDIAGLRRANPRPSQINEGQTS